MKISKCHQYFATQITRLAIETPEEILGFNYIALLNFWNYLDTLDREQWRRLVTRYNFVNKSTEVYGSYYSKSAYGIDHFWNNVFNSKLNSPCLRQAVQDTAYEIYIMDDILADGNQLVYVPLFDNL
jgi:hypothetical protein